MAVCYRTDNHMIYVCYYVHHSFNTNDINQYIQLCIHSYVYIYIYHTHLAMATAIIEITRNRVSNMRKMKMKFVLAARNTLRFEGARFHTRLYCVCVGGGVCVCMCECGGMCGCILCTYS